MDWEKALAPILDQERTGTFWSGEAIKSPDIYRLGREGFRWYYRPEPITFYTSITTWLKEVMPTAYFLENWYKTNSEQYLAERMLYASEYGSFAHIMMALLLRHGTVDLSQMESVVGMYWESKDLEGAELLDELATRKQWTRRIKNDLLCLVAFIQEREFEAHAIEWIGAFDGSDKVPIKYACAIDLVGELTFNSTRKTAIVDFKTGNLYDDQVFQLIGNKLAWNQANTDLEVDLLMNLSPKDFSNKSKYTLKNRKVDDDTLQDFLDYASIASRNVRQSPPDITDYDKELSRDSDLSEFAMSAESYIQQKYQDHE